MAIWIEVAIIYAELRSPTMVPLPQTQVDSTQFGQDPAPFRVDDVQARRGLALGPVRHNADTGVRSKICLLITKRVLGLFDS